MFVCGVCVDGLCVCLWFVYGVCVLCVCVWCAWAVMSVLWGRVCSGVKEDMECGQRFLLSPLLWETSLRGAAGSEAG